MPSTSQINKAKLSTHVELLAKDYDLQRDSVALLEQLRTIDKYRLKEKIGILLVEDIEEVKKALSVQLDLVSIKSEKQNDRKNIEVEIGKIVNLLEGISKEYGLDKISTREEAYSKAYEEISFNIKQVDNKLESINKNVKINKNIRDISKGQLSEYAVVEYFKYHGYNSERAGSKLDHLKIDVVAQNEDNKIFIQVKYGQMPKQDLKILVKNVLEIECDNNISKVVAVVAERYNEDCEFLRLLLQNKHNIPIMLIHKYQVLGIVNEFKRTLE